MFTGIVEEAGVIEKITPTQKSIEMTVRARTCGRGVKIGDSVAVNGCCLTAVKVSARGQAKAIQFDLLQESGTGRISNLPSQAPSSISNVPCAPTANSADIS